MRRWVNHSDGWYDSVELTDSQLQAFKIAPVEYREFPIEDQAIGAIDFNEDMSAQVFAPYQGRIVALYAKVGDDVQKGQTLFTIDSPDLIQAESNLITTAGLPQLTTKALTRTKALYEAKGAAQKDLEQATSDQQTAEGNFKAAQDAVRIFGKPAEQIDKIVATRHIDPVLVVPSPISGRMTARNGAPGLFVQPGNAPAPFTVADISTLWMLANVPESMIPRSTSGRRFPPPSMPGRAVCSTARSPPSVPRSIPTRGGPSREPRSRTPNICCGPACSRVS
jgi:cobalt-zinc-cadmium efflux system membrane fusion protein